MKITPKDLRQNNVFKYNSVAKKWICKQYKIKTWEFDALLWLDCLDTFYYDDYKESIYLLMWSRSRWGQWKRDGLIVEWRRWSKKSKAIYRVSEKTRQIIDRYYRILLGEERIPMDAESVTYRSEKYMERCINTVADKMNKDMSRKINQLYNI